MRILHAAQWRATASHKFIIRKCTFEHSSDAPSLPDDCSDDKRCFCFKSLKLTLHGGEKKLLKKPPHFCYFLVTLLWLLCPLVIPAKKATRKELGEE